MLVMVGNCSADSCLLCKATRLFAAHTSHKVLGKDRQQTRVNSLQGLASLDLQLEALMLLAQG